MAAAVVSHIQRHTRIVFCTTNKRGTRTDFRKSAATVAVVADIMYYYYHCRLCSSFPTESPLLCLITARDDTTGQISRNNLPDSVENGAHNTRYIIAFIVDKSCNAFNNIPRPRICLSMFRTCVHVTDTFAFTARI